MLVRTLRLISGNCRERTITRLGIRLSFGEACPAEWYADLTSEVDVVWPFIICTILVDLHLTLSLFGYSASLPRLPSYADSCTPGTCQLAHHTSTYANFPHYRGAVERLRNTTMWWTARC